MKGQVFCFVCVLSVVVTSGLFRPSVFQRKLSKLFGTVQQKSVRRWTPNSTAEAHSPKQITKGIMQHFTAPKNAEKDKQFAAQISRESSLDELDGQHVLTLMFQCARTEQKISKYITRDLVLTKIQLWDRVWTERDISTFLYGIRSMQCINPVETSILKLGASKIVESPAQLTSRSIGNALYGLREITSDTPGAPELCSALAGKIETFSGDMTGQDIGIGLYGLQGMSSAAPEVRRLVRTLAGKIAASEAELDAQALSNALYGMQSLSSDVSEVLLLVSALTVKVSEASNAPLCAQAIGSALYGLQKLSSDAPEVRSLVAALAEKVASSPATLDAQAIGNALFGLQRMRSKESAEVRALVHALAGKIATAPVPMDAQGIGSALYGLHSMTSDSAQVRTLLAALAARIEASPQCFLSGQNIADALYGLYGMTTDCPELRALLTALGDRINAEAGTLDSQAIGNALYGLQGLSSELPEVRGIIRKLAEKVKRSTALLRSQHIGRAIMGLQRFGSGTPEVRYLVQQLTTRIAASERTSLTGASIADALYGLQGLSGDNTEVQELLAELAKKIAATNTALTSEQLGRALFGLQGLRTEASVVQESALGLESDEKEFLLSALWDKIKARETSKYPFRMYLRDIAQGMLGITQLRDPLGNNIRAYLYQQLIWLGETQSGVAPWLTSDVQRAVEHSYLTLPDRNDFTPIDAVFAVRGLKLNNLPVPEWLQLEYTQAARVQPGVLPLSRSDRLVVQAFTSKYPAEKVEINILVDGFRLDLCFPDVRLNVELDGPKHQYASRVRSDAARDDYLAAQGYKVMRWKVVNSTPEAVAKEIFSAVSDLRREKTEREIQQLYARK